MMARGRRVAPASSDTWRELKRLGAALWNTGRWYIQVTLGYLIICPLVITVAAFSGSDAFLWAAIGAMPVSLLILPFGFVDPMFVAVLASIKRVNGLLKRIVLKLLIVFGLEMAYGLTLFWVRPSEYPGPFLILLLIILAIIALVVGADWVTGKTVAKTAVLVLAFLALLLVGSMYFGTPSGLPGGSSGKMPPSAPATSVMSSMKMEEYHLSAREEMLTAMVGPGASHRIWANKAFLAISDPLEAGGERVKYNMPSGWSSWNGNPNYPAGRLRIAAKQDGTIVRVEVK